VGNGEEAGSHTLEIGFKDDGSLTAVKGHTEQCYNFARQMENLEEGCKCENLYCVASYYYDNHGTYSCYKDRGTLTNIVSEVFDQIATALDMDPVDVALVNDGSYGKDMAWLDENVKAQQGFDPTRDSLKECLEIGKTAFDWDSKWHLPGTKILPNGNYHGVAFRWTNAWGHSPSRVATGIRMHKDGTAVLLAQSCDIGVNRNTTYCQVAADELGLKYENVFMQSAEYSGFDTKEPGGSSGLNGTLPGIVGAARNLKQLLLEFALEPLPGSGGFFGPPTPATPSPFEGKTTADLDIKDGLVFEKANPGNTMEVVKLAAAHANATPNKLFAWDYPPAVTDQKYALGKQLYFMEVEVDPDTGKVYVKKLVIVNDAGKLITPESFEGQQYGGSYMGIGRSNQEEVIWDPTEGVKLTDDLINYPIALMNDCESMEYYQIETGLGYTAYGTFGIGESGGANVCNLTRYAVHNAIGKWVDLKTKPDKILKALGKV
jgi:xanthine dehydrogenase molybdenum-binding subunit